jgi:hypothetical protein
MADNNEVSKEIANAIANGPHAGEPIDEDELIEELETLEQEVLDAQMLNTGTVPVLPTGPVGESEYHPSIPTKQPHLAAKEMLTRTKSKGNRESGPRKRTTRPSCGNCKPRWRCDAGGRIGGRGGDVEGLHGPCAGGGEGGQSVV